VLGVVTDTGGAAIPSVSVSLLSPQKGSTFSATTDATGNYEFKVVPAGEYKLTASKNGFKQNVRSAFAVHASEHVRVGAELTVGAITETVTVSDTPPVVNTTTGNEGNTVTGEQVNTLPTNDPDGRPVESHLEGSARSQHSFRFTRDRLTTAKLIRWAGTLRLHIGAHRSRLLLKPPRRPPFKYVLTTVVITNSVEVE